MKTYTFFGHRECPDSIKEKLIETLKLLIQAQDVVVFYVGCQGNFDGIVTSALCSLKQEFPHIRCYTVLDKLPHNTNHHYSLDTIYPDNFEKVPKRFAIDRRNHWMLQRSDYVLTYIKYNFGGAAKFGNIAKSQEKNNCQPAYK